MSNYVVFEEVSSRCLRSNGRNNGVNGWRMGVDYRDYSRKLE